MYNGVINIYKEKGFTSHDVVAKLRGILHQKKIGHTGTLDPDAAGVLPVCLGKATKACGLLADRDKSYRADCQLGVETDTQDMTGSTVREGDYSRITVQQLEGCLEGFCGDILQIPPMYSAKKVHGKKLYELAREGKTVERKPERVHISSLELVAADLEHGRFTMDVTCSKGTYIRTLCHDIGRQLGCFGAMASLTRTRVFTFRLEDALTLREIEALMEEGEESLRKRVVSVDALFPEYPALQIREEFAGKLANGNPLLPRFLKPYRMDAAKGQEAPGVLPDGLPDGDAFLVYDEKGHFKAIYRKGEKELRVKKMF